MNGHQRLKMYLLYIVYDSTIKLTLNYESSFNTFYDSMIKIALNKALVLPFMKFW